jgi:hypothetical protein
MDPRQRDFWRNLLHHGIHAAIRTIIWRLPLALVIGLLAILIFVVIYFRLY